MTDIPEGWKLVPIEPTKQMLEAGCDTAHSWPTYIDQIRTYQAMLDKAPKYFVPVDVKFLDYVLATKYVDGKANDPWALGFYVGRLDNGHYNIVDDYGTPIRADGFRRIGLISKQQGSWLWSNVEEIESAGIDLWLWIETIDERMI